MTWVAKRPSKVSASPAPSCGLVFLGEFEWIGSETVEARVFEYQADLLPGKEVKWTNLQRSLGAPEILPKGRFQAQLVLPLDLRTIRRLEELRPSGQGLQIEVSGSLSYVEISYADFPVAGDRSPQPRRIRATSSIRAEHVSTNLSISSDDWRAVLPGLGWDELEVFEVPVRRIRSNERLRAGLQHLQAAQVALRQGNWPSVVIEVRRSIEAVAASQGMDELPKDQLAAAFEELIRGALPGEADQPKREVLGSLMKSLTPLRDAGAHARHPRFQLYRDDAELALTVAVCIFRYLGEALSDPRQS